MVKAVVLKTCQEAQDPEKVCKTLLPFYPLDSDYLNLPCQVALEYIGMLIMSCCSRWPTRGSLAAALVQGPFCLEQVTICS